jgi:hypothetical protein
VRIGDKKTIVEICHQSHLSTPAKSLFLFFRAMFDLLRMVALIGFNPSGPDSADKIVSDDCAPEFQKTVARRASHVETIGEMAVHCADGNMPGRWDRPVFDVTTTEEEMSGILIL